MRAVKPVGHLLCTLALLALSACGGGGSVSGNPPPVSPSSTTDPITSPVDTAPANGTVVVTSGAVSTIAGTFTATPGTTSALTVGGLPVTLQSLETDDLHIAVGLTPEPGKYLLAVAEKGTQQSYGCIGGTWSADELDALASQIGQTPTGCPSGVVVNTTAKQLTLNMVSLPSAPVTAADGSTAAGPVLVLSATKLDWSTNTLADNTVSVDVGNSTVTAGIYAASAGLSSTDASLGVAMNAQTLNASAVNIGVGVSQDDPSKFALSVQDNATGNQYICLGGPWTDTELQSAVDQFGHSVIACPTGVSVDSTQHLITLTKVTLQTVTGLDPLDADPTKLATITVSANLDWTHNTPADATPAASAP